MAIILTVETVQNTIENNKPVSDGILHFPLHFNAAMEDHDITIDNLTFENIVWIRNFKTQKPIIFTKCTFNSIVQINGCYDLFDLQFIDCQFNSECTINFSKINTFILKDSHFKHGIISENLICNILNLSAITSNNAKFVFHEVFVNTSTISKMKDASDIILTSYKRKDNIPSDSEIGSLSYVADPQFTGSLIVFGTSINVLGLSGYNKSGRLIFQDMKTRLISCAQFINTGLITVSNLRADLHSIIQLHRSNLGKCEVFDTDFTAFKSIKIDNSNVQEIIPTNVVWCEQVLSNILGANKQAHLREIYRQLKNVMVRQNDKIQELKYHELEMKAYLKQISNEKGKLSDRFIVWSNQISNRHGLSWTRALFLLLLIGLIVFQTNKWLLGYNYYNPTLFFKDCANFIESLNPIRKFSDVYTKRSDNSNTHLAILVDVIFRIIASYLIFQFISAFRKYVKK